MSHFDFDIFGLGVISKGTEEHNQRHNLLVKGWVFGKYVFGLGLGLPVGVGLGDFLCERWLLR